MTDSARRASFVFGSTAIFAVFNYLRHQNIVAVTVSTMVYAVVAVLILPYVERWFAKRKRQEPEGDV